MVRIELSEQDIALIGAAEQHRFACPKCAKATTISPRERICLQGLLHYSKLMRMFRTNTVLRDAFATARREMTP